MGWFSYLNTHAYIPHKLHFFPNDTPGEKSLCTKVEPSFTKHKKLFVDPSTFHPKKTCQHCLRKIEHLSRMKKLEATQ